MSESDKKLYMITFQFDGLVVAENELDAMKAAMVESHSMYRDNGDVDIDHIEEVTDLNELRGEWRDGYYPYGGDSSRFAEKYIRASTDHEGQQPK